MKIDDEDATNYTLEKDGFQYGAGERKLYQLIPTCECAHCHRQIDTVKSYLSLDNQFLCGPCYIIDPPQQDIDEAVARAAVETGDAEALRYWGISPVEIFRENISDYF